MFLNPFRKSSKKKGKAGKAAPPRGKASGATSPKGGKSSSPAKGGPSKGRGAVPPAELSPPGMSLDRKLDILGIVLVFVGIISGFSLFTENPSPILAAWLNLLTQLAGWGKYGLPLGFAAAGLWLVLRKFGDRLPRFEPERLVGLVLLYLALLASLHFSATATEADVFVVVETGRGGGLIGAAIMWGLLRGLGTAGSAVLLAAWWIIAIVFTAGLSVPEIVALISGSFQSLRRPLGRQGERQLPLPSSKGQAARDAGGSAERPGARASAPLASEPRPGEAGGGARPAGPRLMPSAARPEADKIPPPVPTPAPSYDQPLVIGGDQPWVLPALEEILEPGSDGGADDAFNRQRAQIIEKTLASFGAPVIVKEINPGPVITQFGVEPDFVEQRGGKKTKVKVGKIAALADDLALALSAQSIRIEAPVPGKGYVGIEVPNAETSLVALRDVMESEAFGKLKGTLRLGLGQDVSGGAICADLANMPHLLIAGTTGSGKSVCVNSIITCLLLQNTPDDLKFVMVDPKRVELTAYNGIPHLLSPVVVELERVVASLQWVTREMDERYRKFAKSGVRNITEYNTRATATNEKKLQYLIVIIDELADLMMLAPDETERTITRLAQLARATGIHLIIATQRPSVDVVTGLIKANFPARIAFAVASGVDSRVILDQPGAERLLGRGDMLFQSPDAAVPLRMQGVFVSESEIQRVVRHWKGARGLETLAAVAPLGGAAAQTALAGGAQTAAPLRQSPLWEMPQMAEGEARPDGEDELLEDAIQAVREMKKASISLLQRRLRIGYTRAARLIDALEEKGIVGPAESGAKPREVINFGEHAIDPTRDNSSEKRTWTSE